jgi:hypothetical protein
MKMTKDNPKSTSRNRRKYLIIGITSIFLMLAWIITQSLNTQKIDNATVQLSKIDFQGTPDDSEISKITQELKKSKGIKTVSYFKEYSSLITSFDNTVTNSKSILALVQSNSMVPAKLFVISEDQKKSGCPMHNPKLMFGWMKNIFKFS